MKTITLEFEDLEWQILEDGIRDPTAWIQNAANVKMSKVRNRIVAKEQDRLIADPTVATIPATVESIVQSHLNQPGYLKASERTAQDDPLLP